MTVASRHDTLNEREAGQGVVTALWGGLALVLVLMWAAAMLVASAAGIPTTIAAAVMTVVTIVNIALARRLATASEEPA